MVLISVVTPTVDQAGLNTQDYRTYCQTLLGTEKLQLCKLVPLEPGEACDELVVRLDAGMSLQNVETLLEEKERFEGQLTQAKEALKHFSSENTKLKELLSQNKGQRMRSLEDENRKLRSVLQNSLESEKQTRSEQRQTVEQMQATILRLEEKLKEQQAKPPDMNIPKLQFPKTGLALPKS